MTKADLIESVASKLDLPKGQAERAVNTVFEDIVGALRNGDKVNISGFGTFGLRAQGAHGAQPQDRREHSDRRLEVGEVQGRQDAEGPAELTRRARAGGRVAGDGLVMATTVERVLPGASLEAPLMIAACAPGGPATRPLASGARCR